MTPQAFIAALGPAATASMVSTRIPASFVVAEGALESAWGSSQLALQALNLFGVKADPSWHGPTFSLQTREFIQGKPVIVPALWRKYGGWAACIADHAQFLTRNPRYAGCFIHRDGPSFAQAVAAAGYATDPDYAQKITQLITQHGLAVLDTKGMTS